MKAIFENIAERIANADGFELAIIAFVAGIMGLLTMMMIHAIIMDYLHFFFPAAQ